MPFTKTKSLYLLDANLNNSKSVAAKRQNGLKVMGVLVKTKKYFFFHFNVGLQILFLVIKIEIPRPQTRAGESELEPLEKKLELEPLKN